MHEAGAASFEAGAAMYEVGAAIYGGGAEMYKAGAAFYGAGAEIYGAGATMHGAGVVLYGIDRTAYRKKRMFHEAIGAFYQSALRYRLKTIALHRPRTEKWHPARKNERRRCATIDPGGEIADIGGGYRELVNGNNDR